VQGHFQTGAYPHLTDETKQAVPAVDEEAPMEPQAPEESPTADVAATNGAALAEAESEQPAEDEPATDAGDGAETTAAIAVGGDARQGAEQAPVAIAEEPEAVAEAQPEAEAEPVAPPEPEAAAELESAAEPEAAAEPQVEPEPAPEASVETADEPMTMAELLDQPDVEVKSLKHGDVVDGKVVRIDPDEILIDFGGKSEGVVSNRELVGRRGRDGDDSRPELSMGDEVLVYVLQPESPEGHAVLSLRRAGLERKWRAMQERFEAGEIVEARVIDHNKGGLIVDLGVRGFVPISQIVDFPRRPRDEQPRDAAQEIAEKLQPFVGRTLRLKILEVNRKANRLILSEKVALYEERREKRDELFSSLQVGQRVTGTVRSIAPFGVFVDLGGIDGLVHKSELSWNKVNNPETAHAIGDEVEAEVIDINHERGRISLSIRRLQPDPWQESVAKYHIGDVITGTVTKLVNFGAFVRVEEGLEGLIHISELSNQRVAHPGDVVKESEVLQLKIISLDSERHRLGLSLKQAEDRPAAPQAPTASASAGTEPNAAQARYEERPPQRRERRDRRERGYRPEDAISEPDEGIDNTMAAAFAESGLLDQFRADQAARESGAEAPAAVSQATAEEPADETTTAEAPTEEPDTETAPDATAEEPAAETMTADTPPEESATEAAAEAPAEEPATEATAEAAPEAETASEAEAAPEAETASEAEAAPEAEAQSEAAPEEPAEAAAQEPAEAAPAADAPEAEADSEAKPSTKKGAKSDSDSAE
jgi:small subunit ribosomal protein S1